MMKYYSRLLRTVTTGVREVAIVRANGRTKEFVWRRFVVTVLSLVISLLGNGRSKAKASIRNWRNGYVRIRTLRITSELCIIASRGNNGLTKERPLAKEKYHVRR